MDLLESVPNRWRGTGTELHEARRQNLERTAEWVDEAVVREIRNLATKFAALLEMLVSLSRSSNYA